MTLDTFKSKVKKYRLFEMTSLGILFLGISFLVFPTTILEDRADRVGFDTSCLVIAVVSGLIFAVVIFYGVARFPQKRLRQLGLICPNCDKPLVGNHKTQLSVIKTGCCRFCGAKVIDSAA